MKFCYVDESGLRPEDPCAVMVGIIVDAQRHQRTRDEFHGGLFDDVQEYFSPGKGEFKGSKLFSGRDRWKKLDPEVRRGLVVKLSGWVGERKHHIAVAAVDKARCADSSEIDDEWIGAALHIALQNQRRHQKDGAKGRTILVFDDNKQKMPKLCDLLWDPPAWTDSYYGRSAKEPALDSIVDSAFAIKSHHAGLVQIADLYALILRRHFELIDYGAAEEFTGEQALIDDCLNLIGPRILRKAHRYPNKTAAGDLFASLAPTSLVSLAGGVS